MYQKKNKECGIFNRYNTYYFSNGGGGVFAYFYIESMIDMWNEMTLAQKIIMIIALVILLAVNINLIITLIYRIL